MIIRGIILSVARLLPFLHLLFAVAYGDHSASDMIGEYANVLSIF